MSPALLFSFAVAYIVAAQPPERVAIDLARSAIFQKLPEFSQKALHCLAEGGLRSYEEAYCSDLGAQRREPFADLSRVLFDPVARDWSALTEKFGKNGVLTQEERQIQKTLNAQTDLCLAAEPPMGAEIFFRNLPKVIASQDPRKIPPYQGGDLTKEQATLVAASPMFRFGIENDHHAFVGFGLEANEPTFLGLGSMRSGAFKPNISPEISMLAFPFLKAQDDSQTVENIKEAGRRLRRRLYLANPDLRKAMIEEFLFQNPAGASSGYKSPFLEGEGVSEKIGAEFVAFAEGNRSYYKSLENADVMRKIFERDNIYRLEDGTYVRQSRGDGWVYKSLGLPPVRARNPAPVDYELKGERDDDGFYKNPRLTAVRTPKIVTLNVAELKKLGLPEPEANRFLNDLRRRLSGTRTQEVEQLIAKALLADSDTIKDVYNVSKQFMDYRADIIKRWQASEKSLSDLLGVPQKSPYRCARSRQQLLFNIIAHKRAIALANDSTAKSSVARLEQDGKSGIASLLSKSKLSVESKGVLQIRISKIPFQTPALTRGGLQTRFLGTEAYMDSLASQFRPWPPAPEMASLALEGFEEVQAGKKSPADFLSVNAFFSAQEETFQVMGGFLVPEAARDHWAFAQFVAFHELGHSLSPDLPREAKPPKASIALSSHSRKMFDELKACMQTLSVPFTHLNTGVNLAFEEDFADLIGAEAVAYQLKSLGSGPEALIRKAQLLDDLLSGMCSTARSDWDAHATHRLRYLRLLLNPSLNAQIDGLVNGSRLSLSAFDRNATKDCGGIFWQR